MFYGSSNHATGFWGLGIIYIKFFTHSSIPQKYIINYICKFDGFMVIIIIFTSIALCNCVYMCQFLSQSTVNRMISLSLVVAIIFMS